MSSSNSGSSHPIRGLLGALTAVALAAAAAYVIGPWSLEPVSRSAPPRPAGTPVKEGPSDVSILGAGDILLHPELWEQARRDGGGAFDFRPMFASVTPAISRADLALCHLETALAPPNGPFIGFPRFSVPREIVPAIKAAGFDGCSTASNHSIDQGYDGVKRTLDALDAAKLGHAGSYRTAKESRRIQMYKVKDIDVAHLSYTKSFNGIKPPKGKEWIAELIDPEQIGEDAAIARQEGAEIVVVSLHWGTEYEHEPDVEQQTWARKVAAKDDVDIVFGHHAHVVQPVENIDGTWVIYGMGNQIARHEEPINENREGVMMRVTFTPGKGERWKVSTIEALPTFVDLNPEIRLIDLERALADRGLSPGRRRIYEAAVDRIHGHVLTRAADTSGLILRGAPPTPSPSVTEGN